MNLLGYNLQVGDHIFGQRIKRHDLTINGIGHGRGASGITIIGFDLDDKNVDPVKRGKLIWARTLLRLIGHEC